MQEFITIEKNPELENSQNFQLLREAGLKHIEALGSDLWTDYNSHDPGITLMEVLAYAITDLGYRTGNDINDILKEGSTELNNHAETFHKATKILPCNQVTELDLREILIDVVGVRNAWIKIATEIEKDYYINYNASVLTFTDPGSGFTSENIKELNGLYHIVVEFDRLAIPINMDLIERDLKERKVLYEVKRKLMEYRNFCEDYFIQVRPTDLSDTPVTQIIKKPQIFEKVVIWADVEVESDAEMEKVHAEIYFKIEQFLVPYVSFYSLKERLATGKTVDEIFEGPLLTHGFIDEDELEAIQPRTELHISDLYQVVMDVPGVKAVKSMKAASYLSDNGIVPNDVSLISGTELNVDLLLASAEDWVLDLATDPENSVFYELALDTVSNPYNTKINRTIKFYTGENNVPVSLDASKTENELNVLRENDRKRRERLTSSSFEIEIPDGEHLDLSDYFPAQNELPEVYGTGLSGLADEVTEERKAQAKQLKGFLILFEQILANYLAQLNNVRHLFSWDDSIDKTYYTQVLNNIKNRDELYVEEFGGDPLSPASVLDTDQLADLIQSDAESAEVFYDRRSRFLNHLIARFNEKFVDYTIVMHSLNLKDDLLSDKAEFLKEYDLISMNRGRGFDYAAMRDLYETVSPIFTQQPDVWDTTNVTGYQHRVCRFIGLSDHSRRFLYSGHNMRIETRFTGVIEYRYALSINESTGLNIIGEWLNTAQFAIDQFDSLIENQGKENVEYDDSVPQEFTILNETDVTEILGICSGFADDVERDAAIAECIAYFENVSKFTTAVFSVGTDWNFSIEISDATTPFDIVGLLYPTEVEAQTALADFLQQIKDSNLGFVMPDPSLVTGGEFYFDVTLLDTGVVIATSDKDSAFVNDEPGAMAGKDIAATFLNEYQGYLKSESGLHVVEHILLRPKEHNMSLLNVDVKEYDSIDTVENPPVAYPADYDGVYDLTGEDAATGEEDTSGNTKYVGQYFLSSEVELTDAENDNPFGNSVNILEPYFYTLSTVHEDEPIGDSDSATFGEVIAAINDEVGSTFLELKVSDPSNPNDSDLWDILVTGEEGCDYANYVFGSVQIAPDSDTYHYYFIKDGNDLGGTEILGGLVLIDSPSDLTLEVLKTRALRANAYFCDNTTCKGVSNPYTFRATVVLPAWTDRAKSYNYRQFAEEIIRLEAPAHVALDIFWVSRAQMKSFELCYREWLTRQGEFLFLDRSIQQGLLSETNQTSYVPDSNVALTEITAPTNVSNAFLRIVLGANCLIEAMAELVNVYDALYISVTRNDEYFSSISDPGYVIAWLAESADGSIFNQAEIVSGTLPDFLGFYTGVEMITSAGTFDLSLIPESSLVVGNFVIVDQDLVTHGDWAFTVKTYSDTGQVSCTEVVISIFKDTDAVYTFTTECYNDLAIGDIVMEITDADGLISSAVLQGATPMPTGLLLLTDGAHVIAWATGHGLDPNDYQAGDVVVDALLTGPINDPIINTLINIQTTDITGGITLFANQAIVVLGNALNTVVKSPKRNVGTYNLANTVYTTDLSDVLITITDGHSAAHGIVFVDGSEFIIAPPSSGISVRVNALGQVEVFVANYALFEAYVNGLALNADGSVTIPITQVAMTDTCNFPSTWTGEINVCPDREPVAVETHISCAGVLQNVTVIKITDPDLNVFSYSLSPAVTAHLASIGISHGITPSSPGELKFNVASTTTFLNGIQVASNYPQSAIINGVEVSAYEFSVDIVDGYGAQSTLTVRVLAPVNLPFECVETYPSGTSYLAYLYPPDQIFKGGGLNYSPNPNNSGKTVMSFTDANGIQSISCSCKKCDGSSFSPIFDFEVFDQANVTNYLLLDENLMGDTILFTADKESSPSNPVPAKKGSKVNVQKSFKSEKKSQLVGDKSLTNEKLISKYGAGKFPFSPALPDCTCLTDKGLALDKVNNRIYVADADLFRENGIGTLRFSIAVVDKCGIRSCKNITFVIAKDKPAVYVDVKNKSYLNALTSGSVIGYPVDPDGAIQKAEIVLYNPATELMAMPVNPGSLLPPGMMFNKSTGEIRVSNIAPTNPVDYTDGVQVDKGSISLGTKGSPIAETPAPGKMLFKSTVNTTYDAGVSKKTSDWNVQGKSPATNTKMASSGTLPITSISGLQSTFFSNVWISNPGKLQVGTWTIYVLTTDLYAGTTIIEYTIVVKKNVILKGVAENLGFSGFSGVKTTMKSNYTKILKSEPAVVNTTTTAKTIDDTSGTTKTTK